MVVPIVDGGGGSEKCAEFFDNCFSIGVFFEFRGNLFEAGGEGCWVAGDGGGGGETTNGVVLGADG